MGKRYHLRARGQQGRHTKQQVVLPAKPISYNQARTITLPLQKCKQKETVVLIFFPPHQRSKTVTNLGHMYMIWDKSGLMQLQHTIKLWSLLLSAITVVQYCRKQWVTY